MKKFSKRSEARKERGNLCVWFASALESSEDCTNLPVLQATLLSKLLDPNTNLLGLVGLLFVAPQRSPHPVAAREAVHRPASTAGNHVHRAGAELCVHASVCPVFSPAPALSASQRRAARMGAARPKPRALRLSGRHRRLAASACVLRVGPRVRAQATSHGRN